MDDTVAKVPNVSMPSWRSRVLCDLDSRLIGDCSWPVAQVPLQILHIPISACCLFACVLEHTVSIL